MTHWHTKMLRINIRRYRFRLAVMWTNIYKDPA